MDILLLGKVNLQNEDRLQRLLDLGLAQPITHKNVAFHENRNTNTTLDFILNNLK